MVAACLVSFVDESVFAQTPGVRDVSASDRAVIQLQTRLRFTTMVVLPEGEEILDVICGDKDFWVISATHNLAHIKPAKEGAATNLNLVTASGTVYSFLLNERSGTTTPDVKVYVTADPNASPTQHRFYSASEVARFQTEVAEARAAVVAAERRTTQALAPQQEQ